MAGTEGFRPDGVILPVNGCAKSLPRVHSRLSDQAGTQLWGPTAPPPWPVEWRPRSVAPFF